jgi:uncharacterized RDD family membrane protein YckC
MESTEKGRFFDPHETAQVEALRGAPLASFGSRAAAFAIDFVLVLVTYIPIEIGRQFLVLNWQHRPLVFHVNFDFHEPGNVVWLLLYFGLFAWLTNGQTPGKRLMRIRIVSLVHKRITWWQAVERALGYGASILEGGFGFAQYFIHPNRCCVHDRIAETIVVAEKRGDSAAEKREHG